MPHSIIDSLRQITEADQRALAVFDLDSTLFNVSTRSQKIIHDYAESPIKNYKFPTLTPRLKQAKIEMYDWGIEEALQRLNIERHHQEFLKDVHSFWRENFFSNHYLNFDIPYSGAVEFVNELANLGVEIAYLTGRDVARMGGKSETVLKDWGFPVNDLCQLILKPHLSMDDAEFKTNWFRERPLNTYGRVVFFENEPVNINHLSIHCPQVEIIYFESVHSGKQEVQAPLKRISNFLKK